jgi:hydroxymethylglutaryl-CoA synthase
LGGFVTDNIKTNEKLVMRPLCKVGILGWGAYIPRYRLKIQELVDIWGESKERFELNLGISEKAVAGPDEDTTTIATEAVKNAISRAQISPQDLRAIFVGTESPTYAVKPTGITIAEAVNAVPNVLASDLEFACKAGTEAMECCMGLVSSGMIKYGVAVGADIAQSRPGDELEFSAASGGAALIIGRKDSDKTVATIEASYSYCTDTPDFWRRPTQIYPKHGETFTGEPGYFSHTINCARIFMNELGLKSSDLTYVVFHQPNGKFPLRAAKSLGFTRNQIEPGLLVNTIGNTYSASAMLGLTAVLEVAKPNDKILMVSYGSGAGSDAFYIIVDDSVEEKKELASQVNEYISRKKYIDYITYLRWRKLIKGT